MNGSGAKQGSLACLLVDQGRRAVHSSHGFHNPQRAMSRVFSTLAGVCSQQCLCDKVHGREEGECLSCAAPFFTRLTSCLHGAMRKWIFVLGRTMVSRATSPVMFHLPGTSTTYCPFTSWVARRRSSAVRCDRSKDTLFAAKVMAARDKHGFTSEGGSDSPRSSSASPRPSNASTITM